MRKRESASEKCGWSKLRPRDPQLPTFDLLDSGNPFTSNPPERQPSIPRKQLQRNLAKCCSRNEFRMTRRQLAASGHSACTWTRCLHVSISSCAPACSTFAGSASLVGGRKKRIFGSVVAILYADIDRHTYHVSLISVTLDATAYRPASSD